MHAVKKEKSAEGFRMNFGGLGQGHDGTLWVSKESLIQ